MTKHKKKLGNVLLFLAFAGPTTLIFTVVIIAAFANGVFLTFTDWNGLSDTYNMVGLTNYRTALGDADFGQSLLRTFHYVLLVVVITNLISFLLAFALTRGYKGQGLCRTAFFTPNLIGGVILGFVWKFIFAEALTQIGKLTGIEVLSSNWLGDPDRAFLALVIVAVWQLSGYLMIIYMAGIIAVPKEVTEAASIDGAVGFVNLRKIILPLIMPSVTICGFMSLKSAFMAYDVNLTLTQGGPMKLTTLVAKHVYDKAFIYEDYGAGQTEALVLFLIVAVITVIQVTLSKRQEVEA